ncbi:hydrolase 1, exosortase A system-associated [Sphingomonas sp. HITSZ_GF]|uniref:hydrolase 1, exosortase A system-associated n=1 Tax=Sphingomonas sp. HITSZ_GF TaxID=3037247 RepID=UPI00240D9F9C|nr:hydrolase 1, exosortase A system-associated [Sphingomonas sp. HITSZ_GF]MDG2532330.1 hydrolase 1, exosortase A system-associated [Sphingomonas sp. HITSZ_GF]
MRRLIAIPCAGETLAATFDDAPGTTGLLIVSGGNEIRIGAHRGMALLAQRVAAAGHPVLRFDRRGIGDSTGDNGGFETSAEDIAAAARAFRETGVERIVAYGNCDAATALAFFHPQAGIYALILANPWTVEEAYELPPAAAIRSHYAAKLRDPKEWLRLLRGGVNIAKLVKGLRKVSQKPLEMPTGLTARLAAALGEAQVPVTILLARGDNTAIAFADAFKGPPFDAARGKVKIKQLDSDSHSFASAADKDWLFQRVVEAL